MFCTNQDVSIILEKRGNTIRFAFLRTYDQETVRILKEAREEYALKKEQGYNREQAFQDFMEVQQEIKNLRNMV